MLIKLIMYIAVGGLAIMAYAHNEQEAIDLIRTITQDKNCITAELLSGGLSGSTLFKVTTLEQAYVVRFWNTQWAEDFPQDLAGQVAASNAGYGPKLFFADEAACVSVMHYLEPEALPEKENTLQAAADLLKQIHTGPEIPKGLDRSAEFNQSIRDTAALTISYINLAAIQQVKNTIFDAIRHHTRLVPCHRDLHPRNIIFSKGRFFAVDYTWAGMDDAYGDLAAIAIFNCETIKEEKRLLELYLEHEPTTSELAHFSVVKTLTKIFYALELLRLTPKHLLINEEPQTTEKSYLNFAKNDPPLNPDNFLEYGLTLLKEVCSYIQSENYSQDLAHLL